MISEFERLKAIIDEGTRFVLTTHVNPDGDGLGCECAMAEFLRSRGKQVSILNHSATPANYAFLDPGNTILQFDTAKHSSIIASADVVLILDTNHPDRLVSLKNDVLDSRATKVCIDHHLDPAPFADLYIIDEPSTATGEIIYKLIAYLSGTSFNKAMAVALYTAIMTDTGGFRYPKTDPEVHRIVAHLIEHGADPVEIHERVFEQGTPNRLQLLGTVLAGLVVRYEGRLAYIAVTRQMLKETGTNEIDTDAFVPYTLSLKGVQIGLMFTEMEDGVKVNFRSKGDIWINQLAKEFGGNGHKNAAGARVARTTLDELIPQVLDQAESFLQ